MASRSASLPKPQTRLVTPSARPSALHINSPIPSPASSSAPPARPSPRGSMSPRSPAPSSPRRWRRRRSGSFARPDRRT
jgi:hypothetical protein